jgi:hypothetical protein
MRSTPAPPISPTRCCGATLGEFLHFARVRGAKTSVSASFDAATSAKTVIFGHFPARSACRFRRNRSPSLLETAVLSISERSIV